jgi:transcriptional regulator with GAF, ATPase, and Fis domain
MEKVENSIKNVKLLENATLQKLLASFVEEAAIITDSKISYFAVINSTEDTLVMLGWSNSAMANCAMIDKPIVYPLENTGMWGDAVRERKPVITNNYEGLVKSTKKGYPAGHVKVVRHFNIPVTEGSHIAGVLGVGNKETDYSQSDVDNLTHFAQELWTIIKKEVPNEFLS